MTMNARGRFSLSLLLLATFAAGILSATVGGNWLGAGDRMGTASYASQASAESRRLSFDSPAAAFESAFVGVAEVVNPAVVQIRSEQVREQQSGNPFEGSPFEDWFRMPDQQPRTFRTRSLGSGAIVRENGYVVTNYHVVREASDLEVVLSDGTYHRATVVGSDEASDLAVIRIERQGLPVVPFGSIDDVRPGQWVLAFGSPLAEELGNSVTSGIVSAVGRTSRNLTALNLFASFIQTDAAINPGNSGGPLVDLRGHLIGINSAIYSRSGGYQGIGFAIPVDVVKNVTDQLIDSGSVERGFLGVLFDGVSQSLAEAMGVPRGSAQITSVTEGSPAEDAGLKAGDIITAVDGHELRSADELRTRVGNMAPGDRVELTLNRDGDSRVVRVELGRRSEFVDATAEAAPPGSAQESDELGALGMTLRPLSATAAERLGLPAGTMGVLVSAIDTESTAYREADMRQGDVIIEADRKPVTSPEELRSVIAGLDSGDSFIVKALRPQQGQVSTFFTALTRP
jgi:serine protease Do